MKIETSNKEKDISKPYQKLNRGMNLYEIKITNDIVREYYVEHYNASSALFKLMREKPVVFEYANTIKITLVCKIDNIFKEKKDENNT